MDIKQLYEKFAESGELEEVFPEATGEWEKDKHDFIDVYQTLLKGALEIEEEDNAID